MRRSSALVLFASIVSSGALGCSAASTPPEDAGASSDATVSPDSATGAPDASPAAQPLPPTIKGLMKMAGGLHVVWKNGEKDCDTIEGERKTAATEYKVAFTVPGAADNKHDGTATEKTAYTYRLRCKRGEVYSDYSNEMSETP